MTDKQRVALTALFVASATLVGWLVGMFTGTLLAIATDIAEAF